MRTHKYKGLMSTIRYNICGDGYDAEERANNIFNIAKNRIDKAYQQGRADAIDEFLLKAKERKYHSDITCENAVAIAQLDWLAEQLKENL